VPVAAGIVLNPFVTAVIAPLDMSAQLGRPTTDHCTQHLALLAGERAAVEGFHKEAVEAIEVGNDIPDVATVSSIEKHTVLRRSVDVEPTFPR